MAIVRTDERMTAAEVVQAAKLDWAITEEPVMVGGQRAENYKALVRADNATVLSIVGKDYRAFQNAEKFAFFDEVIGRGQAVYTGGGEFKGGRRVFIQAKLNGSLRINQTDDIVDKYVLLADSHDRSSCLRVLFTPIRVVCQNTLARALESKDGISIRHTANAELAVESAQRALGIATMYYESLAPVIDRMAQKQIAAQALGQYLKTLFPDNANAETKTRTENIRQDVEHLFTRGKGNDLPGVKGTVWAAYNAVTEYLGHERSVRGRSRTEKAANRMESVLFGSSARLAEKAFDLASDLVGIQK